VELLLLSDDFSFLLGIVKSSLEAVALYKC
jgi:hypothetical protein